LVPMNGEMAAAEELSSDFQRVRAQTEALAAPLSAEDQCVQSMPDASPTKWHRAHTTWFLETFVLAPAGIEGLSPAPFSILFNSYYNAVGEQYHRPSRGLLTRPSNEAVTAYRQRVDAAMLELLESGVDDSAAARIELGLHHEQQHQELLLTDIKHLLSRNPLDPAYETSQAEGRDAAAVPSMRWVRHPGGVVRIGCDPTRFHFDNEGPAHDALVHPFQITQRLVTNGEYLAFIEDGGYERPELWLSDGWQAVQSQRWLAPAYWRPDSNGWSNFTLRGRRAVDENEPVVHVSYYEADAYARWAGARLPTEHEWEASTADPEPAPLCGRPPLVHPSQPSLYGAAWQWTSSSYAAYPGYRPAPGAIGEYNGKFMCGQYVLRGSSCVTPAGHARRSYRNFFPPDARWQLSGIRLARDAE
ncbi:MAG TPA: ergothioneine biosynthesis protein EgtB, partial [Polyangiales bacterium]|nr:ergothioneine biosynthesis protein EgtB [Polyangiales bacterium]